MIRDSQESKEVTMQKIKNLLKLKPINVTNDGLPASEEDFDELFDRLGMMDGSNGSFLMGAPLTDEEIDELYENMINQSDEVNGDFILLDGKSYDFEELVELEKDSRSEEITSLMKDVQSLEGIVEENENFFFDEYDVMSDEFQAMFDQSTAEYDDVQDIMDMIEESGTLIDENQLQSVVEKTSPQSGITKVGKVEQQDAAEKQV